MTRNLWHWLGVCSHFLLQWKHPYKLVVIVVVLYLMYITWVVKLHAIRNTPFLCSVSCRSEQSTITHEEEEEEEAQKKLLPIWPDCGIQTSFMISLGRIALKLQHYQGELLITNHHQHHDMFCYVAFEREILV